MAISSVFKRKPPELPIEAGPILAALPDPVLVIDQRRPARLCQCGGRAISSTAAPRRCSALRSPDMLPADSPLFALIENVRLTGHSVSEYGVTLGDAAFAGIALRRRSRPRPLAEAHGRVVVTLQERCDRRQDRPPADPPQRRAVGHGHGGDAGARGEEPALRHPRRGAASGAECRPRRPRTDPADLRRGRPHLRAGRPHGCVFRPAAARARRRSTSTRCWSACAGRRDSGFARHVRFIEEYDPSLPPVHGNRDLLIQVFLNLVKNAAEACPKQGGEIQLSTAYQHRRAPGGGRQRQPRASAAGGVGRPTTATAFPRICARICSIPSSRPSATATAWAWRWSPRWSATMAA